MVFDTRQAKTLRVAQSTTVARHRKRRRIGRYVMPVHQTWLGRVMDNYCVDHLHQRQGRLALRHRRASIRYPCQAICRLPLPYLAGSLTSCPNRQDHLRMSCATRLPGDFWLRGFGLICSIPNICLIGADGEQTMRERLLRPTCRSIIALGDIVSDGPQSAKRVRCPDNFYAHVLRISLTSGA